MTLTIPGLHHVTAISGAAQRNVDFYAGTLRQRLVKKTVNFDAPDVYHLYYGDPVGRPGTILTFFPFPDAAPGRAGPGMTSAVAYAVPDQDFAETVTALGATSLPDRFGQKVAVVQDPDGMAIELVAAPGAPDAHAFHSVTLWERDPDPTLRLLTDVFGYVLTGTETDGPTERHRLTAPGGAEARVIDVVKQPGGPGVPGAGTIHHIAFRARTDAEQRGWQDRLAQAGHRTTPVIDRQYFNAIYFREPGGVLFEIATDPPGFAVDESVDTLGKSLMLPPRYEPRRAAIEGSLAPLTVPA